MNKEVDEIYILEKYFKPLSENFKGSLNLKDDAAILDKVVRENYIVSVDNFILGIHCPVINNPKDAIIRAIIVAVSDLSAMAAIPYCLFLSLSMPKSFNVEKIKNLTVGIKSALKLTNIKLGGGDLCSYDGPLSICVTVIGKAKNKEILYRKGAKVGDKLIITGNIGEGKIGLDCIKKKEYSLSAKEKNKIIKKFLMPPVLHKFSYSVRKYVNACIDLSDGLIIDAGKIAKNSGCGLIVFSKKIPFSQICIKILNDKKIKVEELASAGDDYQLAFAVDKKNVNKIKSIASRHKIKLSIIGEFIKDKHVYLDNNKFNNGFSHI